MFIHSKSQITNENLVNKNNCVLIRTKKKGQVKAGEI